MSKMPGLGRGGESDIEDFAKNFNIGEKAKSHLRQHLYGPTEDAVVTGTPTETTAKRKRKVASFLGHTPDHKIPEYLEHLRGKVRDQNISMGELSDLQGLASAGYIHPDDMELHEAAGTPEEDFRRGQDRDPDHDPFDPREFGAARKQAWLGWAPPPATSHRVAGWDFDDYLNGYISTKPRQFVCACGNDFPVPSGFRRCACGKQWNSYPIGVGGEGRQAAIEKFLVREIPTRNNVIVARRSKKKAEHNDAQQNADVIRSLTYKDKKKSPGVTFKNTPNPGDPAEEPDHGYSVSLPGHEESQPWSTLTPKSVQDYRERKRGPLAEEGNGYGGWLNTKEEPWRYYHDVSKTIDDPDLAARRALEWKQREVYDNERDHPITTPDFVDMTHNPGLAPNWIYGAANDADKLNDHGLPGRLAERRGTRGAAGDQVRPPSDRAGTLRPRRRAADTSGSSGAVSAGGGAVCDGAQDDDLPVGQGDDGWPSHHHPKLPKHKSTPSDWHRRDKNQRWTAPGVSRQGSRRRDG